MLLSTTHKHHSMQSGTPNMGSNTRARLRNPSVLLCSHLHGLSHIYILMKKLFWASVFCYSLQGFLRIPICTEGN